MKEDKRDVLYLIWKDPKTGRRFTVGKLTRKETFTFEYCEECKEAHQHGWAKIAAFPEKKIYESAMLFPVFSSRLPDPKRRDIGKILEKYGLLQYDAYEMLKKSGGRLPIDTFEFITPVFSEEEAVRHPF